MAFAPFIVDATVTLLRRTTRKERIWQAHREHYYQRLVLSGWTHRRLAIAEYMVMLVCSLSAVALTVTPGIGVVLIPSGVGVMLLGLMFMVDRRWRLFARTHHA
jgi:UDP-N-acetylmuramyl pentapeptide phosphotransferase/UDP-N-acetylglucosamine-1-phosphate transferase